MESKLKKGKWAILVFLCLGCLVFSLPYLLSTRWGFSLLPIPCEVEKAEFSWLGPQKIEGVKYQKNGSEFFAPVVTSPSSFWSLLKKKGQVVIENGTVSYGDIHFEHIHLTAEIEKMVISIDAKGDDMAIRAKITPSIFEVSLEVASDKVHASFETETHPGYISLKKPASLHALGASVTITEMLLPFPGSEIDFAGLQIKADGTYQGFDFHLEKRDGPIQFSSIYSSSYLNTPATINGTIEQFDPMKKTLVATLNSPLIDTPFFPIENLRVTFKAQGAEKIFVNLESPILNAKIEGAIKKGGFGGHFTVEKYALQNGVFLQGMQGKFLFEEGKILDLATTAEIKDSSHPKGSLLLNAKVDLPTQKTEARFVLEDMRLNYLQPFFSREIPLESFIGEKISVNGKFSGTPKDFSLSLQTTSTHLTGDLSAVTTNGSMKGTLHAKLYSPHIRFSLNGEIAEGILHLTEPLHAQLTLTEKMSKFFLNKVNPLSLSSISSSHPLTIEISSQGTAIPIYPFIPENFSLPDCKIELGQIECKNEGNINIALGLLKAKQLSTETLHLWFAPAVVHINKGVITLERTELLIADTFDIALWGTTNLVSDRVDMVLGLTADCLKKAFGIKNLPQEYVLQIGMKGTTDQVKIDTKKATLKIAALLAWQQKDIAGGAIGGVPGAVLGGVLGKALPLPDQNSHTPPAKHPFPWETDKPPVRKKKTKAIKEADKPAKQLFKILLN